MVIPSHWGAQNNNFWRRTHPAEVPIKSKDLLVGNMKADEVKEDYIKGTRGVWVPKTLMEATGNEGDGRASKYTIDAITRTRIYHQKHQTAVATHFAALAQHGLRYFVDEQPTAFSTIYATEVDEPWLKIKRRRKGARTLQLTHPDQRFPQLRAQAPMVACGAIIGALYRGETTVNPWKVPPIPGVPDRLIMSVQVMDAVRRALEPTMKLSQARELVKGLVDRHVFRQVWKLSSSGADSPMESSMRLAATACIGGASLKAGRPVKLILDQQEFEIFDQIKLEQGFEWVTTLDLLVVEMKSRLWECISRQRERGSAQITINLEHCAALFRQSAHVGLQYDGHHHLKRQQRDYDTRSNLDCERAGVLVQRVTYGLLHHRDGWHAWGSDYPEWEREVVREPELFDVLRNCLRRSMTLARDSEVR